MSVFLDVLKLDAETGLEGKLLKYESWAGLESKVMGKIAATPTIVI